MAAVAPVFTVLGSVALICWLYRHEGKASTASKVVLAGLRIALVLLAMFMLSEAVLSVERTGLPYLTILVDDSASQRDRRPVREARSQGGARRCWPRARRRPDQTTDRLADRQGLDPEGPGPADPRAREAAQGPALSGLERGPAAGRGRSAGRSRGGRAEAACGDRGRRAANRGWATASARS